MFNSFLYRFQGTMLSHYRDFSCCTAASSCMIFKDFTISLEEQCFEVYISKDEYQMHSPYCRCSDIQGLNSTHFIVSCRWLLVLKQTDVSCVFFLQYMQFVACHLLLRWMFRKLMLRKECIMKKLTAAALWSARILQIALFLYLYLIYLSNENCTRITSFL